MGALVVCGVLIPAFLLLSAFLDVRKARRQVRGDDVARNRWNLRARRLYDSVGARWYPYELADGRVRWYRVEDDPLDV